MKENKGLALITGASRGIGATIAKGLANDGYRVVLIARNRQNLDKVRDEIIKSGGNTFEPVVLPLDITDYAKIDDEIKEYSPNVGLLNALMQ
jgi:short-subunit dehydrogenase